MTTQQSSDSADDVELLMPWLTNNTLPQNETARLMSALSQRPDLNEERSLNLAISKSVSYWVNASPEPASNIMARVTTRIRQSDQMKSRQMQTASRFSFDKMASHVLAEFRRFYAGIAVGALAGATAASLLLVVILGNGTSGQGEYIPASGPDTAIEENHLLLVTFPSSHSVKETAEVLRDVGAEIVKGPLPSDLFVLRLHASNDSEFESAKKRLEQKSDVIQILGPYE